MYTLDYTEEILIEICNKLQLTDSLYSQATQRYESIANKIKNNDTFSNTTLKMYPHGSFRLKTTVKPLHKEEYDLDFVVELPEDSLMSPRDLYDNIYNILDNDGNYKDMIEKKKRCIRITYANDFHMDIMPGVLFDNQTNEIIVPDRELKSWFHHSNPIGYANWFEEQAQTKILEEYNRSVQASHKIEKVSKKQIAENLEPLRRAVQLVKRYRDIFCDKINAEPVRSIILCTLMGEISSYAGNTLLILESFCEYVKDLIKIHGGKPFVVKNPVVNEVLSEKWKEGNNYKDFCSMVAALSYDIIQLKEKKINRDINSVLKNMFGETLTNSAIINYANRISNARSANKLSMDYGGIINTNNRGLKIQKNTFYGD